MNFFNFIKDIQKMNNPEWNYYRTNISVDPLVEPGKCSHFIREYFLNGEKNLAVFELNESVELNTSPLSPSFPLNRYCAENISSLRLSEYRATHTVSAFFLGIFLEDCLAPRTGSGVEILAGGCFFPFSYLWFLTCLYHDYGYIVEENWRPPYKLSDKPSISPKYSFFQLKRITEQLRITHSPYSLARPFRKGADQRACPHNNDPFNYLLQYSPQLQDGLHFDCGAEISGFRYSQSLVANYFLYCLHELQLPVYNHGIIGGYLLFDRLLKGYVSAYLHSHPGRGESYPGIENFTWHAKSFSIEQIPLFSHVADCIISHNIWKADSEEEAKYQEYGLSKLVGGNFQKIKFQENPLLFILAVIDTIEPYKIYGDASLMGEDAPRIWKSIDLSFQNNVLTISSRYKCRPIEKMYHKAKSLMSWVDITDVTVGDNGGSFSITF